VKTPFSLLNARAAQIKFPQGIFGNSRMHREGGLMRVNRRFLVLLTFGVFGMAIARAQEPVQEAIPNWPAPETWSPHSVSRGVSTMGAITSPLPFIGLAPCRIADTRNPAGPYGAPALAAGVPRNFTLTGQCGIPGVAQAVSLNVTVTNTQGPGFILIYPQGGSQPTVSTLNYVASETIANAAVVPLGSGNGGVTVIAGVSGTDLILDTNGYYAPAGVGASNTFLGRSAGNFTMTGDSNTAVGIGALNLNTTGNANTAIGTDTLSSNTQGGNNTAIGSFALLLNGTGSNNTAIGYQALLLNGSGGSNTAVGYNALLLNGSGGSNTAVGYNALVNSTGTSNIGIGYTAGSNQQTGSHDIYIGNAGVNGESNTIRIGDASFQDGGTIITGISGLSSIGGAPVYVNGGGRMGTSTSSSRRFKQGIRDIAEGSDGLMRLRPVAFKYKPEIDSTGLTQYGLIAEDVAEVLPDLVTYDRDGQPEGVRYHLITPLLLNEVQKQRRTVEAQEKRIEQQNETIEELRARLSRLEARLLAESRR
jgi:hypothetical protein